jgi:hypothetical protein
MSVEIPLGIKYTKVQHGKIRTRATGGGNSTKKHPGKHMQGAGLRIEGELKKVAMAQTEANRRVVVLHRGKKHLVLLSLYKELQDTGRLAEYLDA